MFFAISGYLATFSLKGNFSFSGYGGLLLKRTKSLLIPYLLVSGLGILTVVFLQLFPFSRPFFNNYSVQNTTLNQWFYIWLASPVPYQLWFVRFLICYFLLFPITYFLGRILKLSYIILLVYFWSDYELQQTLGLAKIEVEGFLFFSIGIFAESSKMNLLAKPKRKTVILLLILWLIWVAFRTYLALKPDIDHYAVHRHLIGFTLIGFVLLWFVYDLVDEQLRKWKWFGMASLYSFGVFLFHEPLLTIVKKIVVRVLGPNDLSLLFAFFMAPLIGLLVSLLFSKFLSAKLPLVYGLFTGNRRPS
jgi:peptidoglycan/LPS O-acetylase OafA/YrhL